MSSASIRPFSDPKFAENSSHAEKRGLQPCAICGRATPRATKFVRVVEGGHRFALPSEDEQLLRDDMGFFPVGPECAKRVGAEFVTRQK